MQKIEANNTLFELSFPFHLNRTKISNISISGKCKHLSVSLGYVEEFCSLVNYDNGSLQWNIVRTGIFILGYNELIEEPTLNINSTPKSSIQSVASPKTSSTTIVTSVTTTVLLSIGLPAFATIIVSIIIIVLIFCCIKRKTDVKSVVNITSETIKGHCIDEPEYVGTLIIDDFEENIEMEEIDVESGPLLISPEDLKIISKLGSGGFGSVYKAEYQPNGKEMKLVAVKSIHDEKLVKSTDSREVFAISSEALLMCLLDHPNIVKCFN